MIHPDIIFGMTEKVGEIQSVFNSIFSFTPPLIGGMKSEIESV